MQELQTMETTFNQIVESLLSAKVRGEEFTLQLSAESSQFVRFNRAKVRQSGCIVDGWLQLNLIVDGRIGFREFPFTGHLETDEEQAKAALAELRQEVPQLPADPYLVLPSGDSSSREVNSGNLLPPEEVVPTLLPIVSHLDFTGLYAGGLIVRGYADSAGQKHWFATESFNLDYSLFTPEAQAVKGTFSGSDWDREAYENKMKELKVQLELLSQPAKTIPRGQYRTYFAPAAVADLVGMLSWGAISEASLQQEGSALALLQRREKQLSSKFNLKENFQYGLVPRFNDKGEIAPVELPLIVDGVLVNTLVNSRTAKEYQKQGNGANARESLRAPEVGMGDLTAEQIISALDTGLYVSNLHYLNWSDRPTGRITGMTRYACFWVEKGEIVAPIENLRFDESLYRFWGENLVALTNVREFIPEVDTYGSRHLGGTWVPGMLVADFTYAL